jgi:uncharacterized repeat protein (TIGR03843 family)
MSADELTLLEHGEVEVIGRMPWSSNATFLVELRCGDGETEPRAHGIYKPRRGERPLWDFPSGLDQREVAAYELSEWLGWHFVPPTVRREGPLGSGSIQLYVEHDPEDHYFTLYEAGRHLDVLRRLCAFDFVTNNTDRKSGHVLVGPDDHVWAIDNGLSFHTDFKLRTVIWEFGGEPLPDDVTAALERLDDEGIPERVLPLLDHDEQDAVLARSRALLRSGHFPIDDSGRRYPWPIE